MLQSVFNLFFPKICAGCEAVLLEDEQVICTDCLHRLPLIEKQKFAEEYIKNHFYGRIDVAHAAGLLFYEKKGLSQHLIHQLKYFGDERISRFLGEWLSGYLLKTEWARTVDIIVPVPLHKRRQHKRGYNQVTGFGRALAKNLKCRYDEKILLKVFNSRTQVFKNRLGRTELKGAYFTMKNKEKLLNKHVLLIDDIITTGATLESCTKNILSGAPSKLSIATMAITV